MPHSFTFNADNLGCTIISEDEQYEMVLETWNPSTMNPWITQDEVIDYVNQFPTTSYMWTLISSKPTQEEIDTKSAIANRETRNQLLADSDWTQFNDSPLDNDTKVLWATYRSSLRSLPEHENWPSLEDADWPVAP